MSFGAVLGEGVVPLVMPDGSLSTPFFLRFNFFWISSIGVFEMQNDTKGGHLTWRPQYTYLCTQCASSSVFAYQVWVCLQCTIPKIVGSSRGAPNTQTCAPIYASNSFFGYPGGAENYTRRGELGGGGGGARGSLHISRGGGSGKGALQSSPLFVVAPPFELSTQK